jgi:hypothetical protein
MIFGHEARIMNIKVITLTGEHCISVDDGQKIFDLVHPLLEKGEDVTLDFTDIHVCASPFFNTAIGQLLKDIPIEELQGHLKFVNLSPYGNQVAKKVISNAKEYYSNPNLQKAIDDTLLGIAESA